MVSDVCLPFLTINIILIMLCVSSSIKSTHTMSTSSSSSDVELAFQAALKAQRLREVGDNVNDDQLRNENRNQGLINTIVNCNRKIKHFENKINFFDNNYANSSHMKEIVEKTKELEQHIVGAPRPHRSWRELY